MTEPESGRPEEGGTAEWGPADLHRRLAARDPLYVLDVRNEDEFERFPLEGPGEVTARNVPYYEMLEHDEFDDVVDSFKAYLEGGLADELPRDRPVLAVCAKGDTSAYVAAALRRLGLEAFNLAGGTAAWGDHHVVRTVAEEAGLTVRQLARPARGCLSHIVESGGAMAVIDPLRHVEQYLDHAAAQGLEITLVADTHGHADHISGGPELARRAGVAYHLHPYDAIHPIDVLPGALDYRYLADGQRLPVGDHALRALHVPGHTLGQVVFLLDERFLFAADTLFLTSISRPDLGGHGDTWAPLHHASLRRLLELPDDTLVLPGHFEGLGEADADGVFAAPLGRVREQNRGLRMAAGPADRFVEYILSSLPRFPEEYVEIKRVNVGLVAVGEAEAAELETGKNVCALAPSAE